MGAVDRRIQLLFVDTQGSINLSPGQVWVSWGRGDHTGPYPAPNLLTWLTSESTYGTDELSQCSNEVPHTDTNSVYYPKSPHYLSQMPFIAVY